LKEQVSDLEKRQRLTSEQLEDAKKKATELSLRLQEINDKMDSLSSELAVEKSAHAETSGKLDQSRSDLERQKSLREDLEKRLNQVQDESRQAREELKVIQQQKTDLEEKIKNIEKGPGGVELGTVVVNPDGSPAAAGQISAEAPLPQATGPKDRKPSRAQKVPVEENVAAAGGLVGKVMIVNKEFNFVVINLGSKDKVGLGDEFVVSRDGKTIGEIKVEKVHEFMSAAGFSAGLGDLIKENDKVTKKSK
jgi:predicted RNase H-like nuclease (RuvC/YqgF family)